MDPGVILGSRQFGFSRPPDPFRPDRISRKHGPHLMRVHSLLVGFILTRIIAPRFFGFLRYDPDHLSRADHSDLRCVHEAPLGGSFPQGFAFRLARAAWHGDILLFRGGAAGPDMQAASGARGAAPTRLLMHPVALRVNLQLRS